MTVEQQLAAVERLIEDFRWARADDMVPEHATYNALKVIAKDLRARLPGAPGSALAEIGRRLEIAELGKSPEHGFVRGHLIGVAHAVIGRWPEVRQALENFQHQTDSWTTGAG